MGINTDFSSNRHLTVVEEFEVPIRHPDISFEDGNLAIIAGGYYFLVHQRVLCHHSQELGKLVASLRPERAQLIEGRITLSLDDSPEDMAYFLRVLYGQVFLQCFPLRLQLMLYGTVFGFISTAMSSGSPLL